MAEIVIDHKPASRGVTQLTYVGGSDGLPVVDKTIQYAAAAAVAGGAMLLRKGPARTVALGVAALLAWTGYRAA